MAYRNPAFLTSNLVAVAGAAAISHSTLAAGFGKERLIDYRQAPLTKFNASAANQFIEVDFGVAKSVNRMIIPIGHNLNGCSIELRADTTPTPTTVRDSFTAGAGIIDRSFGSISFRYWRILFVTTGQWQLAEWVLGVYAQTASGIVQDWSAALKSAVITRAYPSRESTFVEAASRRNLKLSHVNLPSADLAIYDAVLASGVGVPFWHWAVDDALTSPLLMLLREDGGRKQDSPVPQATGPIYTVELDMLEQQS